MKRNTKGFYTLEAAIFLPLVILAVLSLGYFMKAEGAWEQCTYRALDESAEAAAKAYDGVSAAAFKGKLQNRITQQDSPLDYAQAKRVMVMYTDGKNDSLTSFRLEAGMKLKLPIGFGREFDFKTKVKYRNFVGKANEGIPMECDGLQQNEKRDPVWVFPYSGEKYHGQNCTYVKASAEKKVLNSSLKQRYNACSICDSEHLKAGTIVYCFKGEDTAYHRGSCRSIVRHSIVMDKSEAVKRGYTACSKCGGR